MLVAPLLIVAVGRAHASESLELALIIGNNHFVGDERRKLRFADDDAFAAAEQFQLLRPRGRIWLLVDPDTETLEQLSPPRRLSYRPPTVAAWQQALEEARAVVREARQRGTRRVTLHLSFSGHGDQGGTLHFADRRLTAQQFRSDLARVGVDNVFALLDGCFLAEVVRGAGLAPLPEPPGVFDYEELQVPSRPAWFGLIAAAQRRRHRRSSRVSRAAARGGARGDLPGSAAHVVIRRHRRLEALLRHARRPAASGFGGR